MYFTPGNRWGDGFGGVTPYQLTPKLDVTMQALQVTGRFQSNFRYLRGRTGDQALLHETRKYRQSCENWSFGPQDLASISAANA